MTGRGLSQLCFGCEPLGGTDWGTVEIGEIGRAIDRALDVAVDFFDTADVYGLGLSEERLSQALGYRRHDVVIATKGGVSWSRPNALVRARVTYDSSPKYIRTAVDNSLRRLRLDVLPIYYIHWPDPRTPIETTFSELENLRAQGKIRSLGCSNYSADQVARACQAATVEYVQLPINILEGAPGPDMIEVCARHQLRVVAYNVLAHGLLTGKYTESSHFAPDDRRSRLQLFHGQRYRDALSKAAQIREEAISEKLTAAQYAIRWVLRQPHVASAIVGIKSVQQLDENAVGARAAVVGSMIPRSAGSRGGPHRQRL
jgi:aryl-alcohol dehydrogenase-like predicted oxidoreductase